MPPACAAWGQQARRSLRCLGPRLIFCLPSPASPPTQAPRLVVAFIIGGTTYEEARAVAELNAAGDKGEGWSAGVRLLLGGTTVQNSASFLKDWGEVQQNERYAH